MSRRIVALASSTSLAVALAASGLTAFAQDMAMDQARLVKITIENLTTGQNFSPSFIVSHGAATRLWALGETASDPLVAVAEGGNVGPFSGEAAGTIGSAFGDAVIAVHTPPGGTRTVYVTVTESHPLLSGVWMLGMTNDGFSGFAGVDAYALTGAVTLDLMGYDAGSEVNNERSGFLGALGAGNERDPEGGVIAVHTGVRGDADAPAEWNFDPQLVARVTITPVAWDAMMEPAEPMLDPDEPAMDADEPAMN
ncbi:MAG: spondin domain-containing protein [Bauldia sp.]|nr:spondin domain-containing protein [Bauldia sp.]